MDRCDAFPPVGSLVTARSATLPATITLYEASSERIKLASTLEPMIIAGYVPHIIDDRASYLKTMTLVLRSIANAANKGSGAKTPEHMHAIVLVESSLFITFVAFSSEDFFNRFAVLSSVADRIES